MSLILQRSSECRFSLRSCFTDGPSICFIHGLTGDAQSTWTAHNTDTKEDIFWPTKYLADQTLSDGTRFPKARILLFGYETEINSLCWLTERTLYHHGHHLLKSLTKLREKCKHRPLLFVAHSLGGLLVKSALIFASDIGNSTVTEEREIYHSTIGIVSFGTPQIFAGNAPLTDMIARLCQLPDHIPQFEDYGSTGWQSDVKTLQTRLNKYKPIAKEIPEVFCYESISNTRSLEQTVPSPFRKGAVHDLCVAVPIDADHADLCKFRTRSREFRKIRNSIQVFYDKSHAVLRRRRTGPLETPNSITSLSSIISRRKFTLKPSLPSRVDFVSGKGPKSRESLLAELENQLTRIRRAVLTGSPGNGKTTLASEFAHRSQEGRTKVQTSSVLWLDAGSDHALQASFMKIFWKLREYCFPYDDAQPINSGQVTENPGQPKERRQPGKDIDQPGKEDTYYALRQALDSVQENDDGIPRTEEDRRFVMRFILDWLYFPGNETWLLVYDDVEDSEAPYLQDYLPQKADRGYVIFTSRRDHKNPLELRDGEIELGPFRRVQSDSSSTAGNGPGYGSHEAATHPTAQDRSFVPPGYEQEPYYRDEPSFFGPDSPPESTPVTVERSLKFPPIRVGSFDREESLKYMETVYDHSQPLSVGNELSRRQTFNEVAEKYCDNPSDITYRIGSAFDESSADPVQQVEKDLRSGDHYEEIPAGYAE
ncbi:hypothetical protein EJ04DRAFT_112741 [Polyplosphaeria fusca]|uniref:Uncharacterized protein n=1 Tax=Polyplosphaeria fusca TaxID=682080 RepID=A0A9P4V5U5_9PLEO|nr:hypothetical protein EJ04DRAFT_112741 [Polyplosphaeria fusca]